MWRQRALLFGLVPLLWLAVFTRVVCAEMVVTEVGASVKLALQQESGPDSSFAQSLTRDFLFFVTFVGQVVLFLIFFWEKPTTTKRWNVGEEAASEANKSPRQVPEGLAVEIEPVASSSGVSSHDNAATTSSAPLEQAHQGIIAPPEGSRATNPNNEDWRASTQLDEDFAPLESTIRDLQHRITGLERTLNRRKGHYPTESLKSRLRECISTISGTLTSLEAQSDSDPNSPADIDRSISPNRIDITKWPLESIQSSKRQLEIQLEQLEAVHVVRTDNSLASQLSGSYSLDKLHLPSHSPSQDTFSTIASQYHQSTASGNEEPTKTQTAPSARDYGLDEHDLDVLAQQLIGPKQVRKGGKVKISAKDVSALNFFSGNADPQSSPSFDTKDVLIPSIDDTHVKQTESDVKSSDVIETKHVKDEKDEKDKISPEPSSTAFPTSNDQKDNSNVDSTEDAAPENKDKSDEDELADLARLMTAAPGKKGKNNKQGAKNQKSSIVSAPSGPANIFNMFSPSTTVTSKSPSPIASPKDSPRSNTSSNGNDSEEGDKATKDLLAQLEGVSMPSLDDLSLPNDFSLHLDNGDDDGAVDEDDLMAALNAVSAAQKNAKSSADSNDSDSDDDNTSNSDDSDDDDDGSNADVVSNSDDEDEELDDIARERPAVSAFSASEALNKSGLARAKKSVPLNKGGKKGAYQMEDYHFCEFPWINENWGLFCVFDGHSGKDCAETAMKVLPGKLEKNLAEVDLLGAPLGGVDLTAVMEKTFLETDKELLEFEYEGCTCTVVFIYKTKSGHRYLQSANVGDSSACLVRKGKALVLTQDHHPNYPKEVERLIALGIEINPGQTRLNGLAVSRALGDQFPKSTECGIVATPSVSPVYELRERDTFLVLASDGLWDVISFQTACDIIKNLDTAAEMSDSLLKTATRSSKCTDNVTTVVVQL
jgi:serine/threonine protein phosphatase PrpC